MSKEIKIGVFGLSRGHGYAEILMQQDEVEVVALCDKREDRLNWNKEQFPGIPAFLDFDEFLAYGKSVGMNAVLLTNYFHEHTPFAIRVMEEGMAAFSECVPAATLKECVDLCRAYERTGSKYMFIENYPFMTNCLELRRLANEGTLGTIMYCEAEYNHHDPVGDLLARTPGKHHWRVWEPRCYYLTHTLGPLMMITGGEPTYVSCRAAVSEFCKKEYPYRPVTDGMAQIFCEFDNGTVTRFSGCNAIASDYNTYRICGDKGSAQTGGPYGENIRLMYKYFTRPEGAEKDEDVYTPDLNLLDPRLAEGINAGHGGSDYMVVRNIVEYMLHDEKPYFDVYRAATMSAVAVYALRSCINHGENYKLPDFRNEEERKLIENDDLTPFEHDDGTGCTIQPTTVPSDDYKPHRDAMSEF